MSNRLTFSLASLIFLIALGLVFAPMSVMAHPNVDADDTHAVDGHMHPEMEFSVGTKEAATGVINQITDAKTDDSDPATATEVLTLEFSLVLTHPDEVTSLPDGNDFANASAFVNVTNANSTTAQRAEAIWITVHDGTDLVGTTTITSPSRVNAAEKPQEWTIPVTVTLTAGTIDTSLTGDNQLKANKRAVKAAVEKGIYVDIKVNANAITSDDITGSYQGQKNLAVTYGKAFQLSDEAPDDTTAPTVTSVTSKISGKTVVFTITFSEPLTTVTGSAMLTADDFVITNNSSTVAAVLSAPAPVADSDEVSYTLTVTPADPKLPVTIMLPANSVDDANSVPNTAYGPSPDTLDTTVNPDSDGPTVKITAAQKLNTAGKAVFTLTFSEMLLDAEDSGALTVAADIVVTNSSDAALSKPTVNAEGEEVYELTATPTDRVKPVVVKIDQRSVIEDRYGNALDVTDTGNVLEARFDDRRPTATVTKPATPESDGKLKFTLNFSEDINESTLQPGTVGDDNVKAIGEVLQSATDSTTYTVLVTPEDSEEPTRVEIADVQDLAGNLLVAEAADTYTPPIDTGVPDPTIAGPDTLSCLTGGAITVTFDEALKADEALAVGDIEITGVGWEIKNFSAANGTFNLMPKSDRSWIGTTQVTVNVKKDSVVDADDNGNTTLPEPAKFTVGPVLTIPANSYIVVVREEAKSRTHLRQIPTLYVGDPHVGSVGVSVQTWDCMPDLGVLLGRTNHTYADNRGGTLVVEGGGGLLVKQSADHTADSTVAGSATIDTGTVGITEIMWAIDRSKLFGRDRNFDHAQEQWIELHNLNTFEVKVTLFDLVRDEAYSYNNYGEVDRMTNYNLPQYKGNWPIRDVGDNKDGRGQDGDSDYGEDFVAMQRGPATTAKNYSHGDFDGRDGSKWKKAAAVYLTRRALLAGTGQLAFENLNYDFIGTPGRSNAIGPTGPQVATPVPLKPFVINEVGNRENRLYDWIELRNTSDAEANLRNYNISIVTGIDKDVSLFNFPNSDIKIGAGEVILVLASDPEDDGEHPIAVGHDVLGGTDQVLGLGENPAKYIVAKSDEGLYTAGLPASNFVLILRHTEGVDIAKPETYNKSHDKANSAKAKIGTHERIVDVAGYHSNLGNQNTAPNYTALWPLKGHGAPFSKNDLKSEGVYFRRDPARIHGENNNDKPAFVSQNYTGVGYRRSASNSAVHGGTPGYNDIRKNLVADIESTGSVTISEIMFDQGDGSYPQWIELYNSSPTNAVNLHSEAGWRLEIRNFDDNKMPFERLSGTLNFKDSEVQTILPQQTVLIASTRARNIGSDTTNASIVFIPTRVFSVWSEKPARDALGMTRSTDPILSEVAFYLELIDGKGNLSDAAGNLTRRRARGDDAYWEWSDVQGEADEMDEMDARSSVIRRYRTPEEGVRPELWERYSDKDIKAMGIEAAGWVNAADTEFRRVARTWYGHDDDYGTPGTTKGKPLPVSLSKFRPERLKDTGEIVIRWVTESELNNAGFNILRSETRTGEFTKINTSLIKGHGTTSERNTYEWKDTTAKPNVVYYYQIQDVSLDGQVQTLRMSRLKGNVTAAGKLTTTWGELKALQ